MYKILLADEEGVALEALRVMIDSEYGEECDIRLAVNVTQMSDIFTKFLPDIVFVNIQMAGMRGISSIREFHNKHHNCLFVILSHNKRTDFGREGANVGIRYYLQKPITRDKVRPLMKDLLSLLDADRKQEELEKYNKQQWDEAIPILESGMISEILFPDSNDSNIDYYAGLLNIKNQYAWIMVLKYSQITEHGTMCNPVGSVIQLSTSNLYFRKIVKAFFHYSIIGPILANHVIVLVPCESDSFASKELEKQKKRVTDMTYQLHRKLNLRFRFGISSIHSLSDLYPAIEEARQDLEH